MTKVIVLADQPKEQNELKPIEFVYQLIESKGNPRIEKARASPFMWNNIELISKTQSIDFYDRMFAYDDDRSRGILYLGHFNDGVIE